MSIWIWLSIIILLLFIIIFYVIYSLKKEYSEETFTGFAINTIKNCCKRLMGRD